MAQRIKNLPAMPETRVWSLGREIPWRREWQPTPVFLPGEFYGQRSLVGYSPRGHKKSDTTEQLNWTEGTQCVCESLSHVPLFMTPWAIAHQAPLSIEFSRQEYWSWLLRDPPNPGIKSKSPDPTALTGRFFTTVPPGKPVLNPTHLKNESVSRSVMNDSLWPWEL